MIADVLHFAFTVRDIEASVSWYRDVLGLELVHRQRGDNEYTRTLVGIDQAILEVAQFRVPGGTAAMSTHVLELIQYVRGADTGAVSLPVNRVGTGRLALIVSDIHAQYERMSAAGVSFVSPPVLVTAGANMGGYACYLRDPDGITLEFMQFDPERARRLGIPSAAR